MTNAENSTYAAQHRARKFRRFARDAQHATVIERWRAVGDDGTDCRITIKRAMRSRGYQSDYEPVLKYWVFMEQAGEPFYAFAMADRPFQKWHAELIVNEPRWIAA